MFLSALTGLDDSDEKKEDSGWKVGHGHTQQPLMKRGHSNRITPLVADLSIPIQMAEWGPSGHMNTRILQMMISGSLCLRGLLGP